MRVLVIGCGSIGRRHIRLLCEMGIEVDGLDTEQSLGKAAIKAGVKRFFYSWHPDMSVVVAKGYDGVIVATPPHMHRDHAMEVLAVSEAGVLVEKPIATSIDDAQDLAEWFSDTKQPLLVGYNLRFHPGLRRVKELLDIGAIGTVRCARLYCGSYLPDWRPGVDYRHGYAAKRAEGGGVILDASHELDYACWLFGEPQAVSCMAQTSGALEIETEDIADITVTFASGVQASIHLDYLDRRYDRGCTIVGDKNTMVWRFGLASGPLMAGPDYPKHGLTYDWYDRYPVDSNWDPDDMYRAELRHFLAVIRGEEKPLCTGEDGLRALRLALAAKESAETGRTIHL